MPLLLVLPLLLGTPLAAQLRFHETTLARDLKGGYQLTATDLNRDGRPDLLALASGMPELIWFENPSWQRHVIAGGLARMINVAALDNDGDGIPELLLAHEFANVARNSPGVVSLLACRNGEPRQPWSIREIDRLPTSHRIRVVRLPGGVKGFVNAPLTGAQAEGPDYRDPVPVVLYRPPEFRRELLSNALQGVLHGIFVWDENGDGVDELLAASFAGVHRFFLAQPGKSPEQLLAGSPLPWPKSGSSEIVVGRLGAKERFFATIDPWHGNEVAVYQGRQRIRRVIDASETDGHTLHAADLTGDGREEIVAGFRGPGRSVFYYQARKDGSWQRHFIDKGGIAAAGCAVADFDRDGRLDVACIGSATANLKLYRNLGDPSRR